MPFCGVNVGFHIFSILGCVHVKVVDAREEEVATNRSVFCRVWDTVPSSRKSCQMVLGSIDIASEQEIDIAFLVMLE